jgi:hypothetical protein
MSNEINATQSNAVEVVATFGDAVVGVRHLTDPRGGVVKRATKALLAGGVALLATSGIAFGYAANVAAKNEAAYKAWTAQGKPGWAFRPQQLPAGLDALTLGGSVLGLGAIAFGLARRKSEQQPSRVKLGTVAGCDFPMEGVGSSFDLVAPMGNGFAVNVAPAMSGAPAGMIPVTADTKLRLKLGATTFLVQSVAAPKKQAAGIGFDRRVAGFIAASVAAHLGVLALLQTVPSGMDTATGDTDVPEMPTITATTDSHETKTEPPDDGTGIDAATERGARQAMALTSGTMGSNTAGDPGKRHVAGAGEVKMSREAAVQNAREAGILGSEFLSSNHFQAMAGTADITQGMDDDDIYGGWDGTGTGSGPGFGNGPNGFGPGGGGNDWNSIWSGDYNTIPGDGHDGDGYTLDDGPNHKGHKHIAGVPQPKMCTGSECKIIGDADPAIIRRYMRRNSAKFGFCYEHALLANPGLGGTVTARFSVSTDGHVTASGADGVSDEVSSCVADVVSNIHFPAFKAPFQAVYPFHMHKAA